MTRIDAPVANILSNPKKDWDLLTRGPIKTAAVRHIDVDWNRFNVNDYCVAHCSIVSSVNVEADGHTIGLNKNFFAKDV